MGGNVNKEGITADLEAMKKAGITCALGYTDQNYQVPIGPVKFMSPEWWKNIRHTVSEAKRLGITLGLHNGPGWEGSSGPWIKPEQSMQMVVTSEKRVDGPGKISVDLPKPQVNEGYYEDVAVLALKVPAGQEASTGGNNATVTSNIPGFHPAMLLDTDWKTKSEVAWKPGDDPRWVQWSFAKPETLRSIVLVEYSFGSSATAQLQSSQDGKNFTSVCKLTIPERHSNVLTESFPPVSATHFRLVFDNFGDPADPAKSDHRLHLSGIALSPEVRLDRWYEKGGMASMPERWLDTKIPGTPAVTRQPVPAIESFDPARIIDVTSHLQPSGRLEWDAPAGQWVLLRVGSTSTGKKTDPANPDAMGLECDKMSKAALDSHWEAMMEKILDATGGKESGMRGVFVESWEAGQQNWTPKMREEFQVRRGYDLMPWLPVLSGRIVGSEEQTGRFLWDWQQTLSELQVENYFGHFQDICRAAGVTLFVEPYGKWGNFQCSEAAQRAEVPMAEFWGGVSSASKKLPGHGSLAKMVASAAHIAGNPIVGAEAFTTGPQDSRWLAHPYATKAGGDLMFASGINRFMLAAMPLAPWKDRLPGMTLGPYGSHFTPSQTWWNHGGKEWSDYLARSQFLLQQGGFVADVWSSMDDQAPGKRSVKKPEGLPAGYDYDASSFQTIGRMQFDKGRVVLPSGMSYRLLVLPDTNLMTPQALQKIRDLVMAGAQVVGPKPVRSPGLEGFPACDEEVKKLAGEIWGDCDGKTVTEHSFGKGKVYWGKPLPEILAGLGIKPDFEVITANKDAMISYIHRRTDDADIYFVANSKEREEEVTCTFRVDGRIPELWYADTGKIEEAPAFTIRDGRTTVPLHFDPAGSVFVVFRKPAAGTDRKAPGASPLQVVQELKGPWEVSFPPKWGAPERIRLENLISWADHADPGVKYFSGTAKYRAAFDFRPEDSQRVFLDLGKVEVTAGVRLNGKDLGILWKPPFRMDITGALKPGSNELEVSVTNLWPNRLIGDEQFPDDCEWNSKGGLVAWPKWLLDGTPRPEPRRLTFTTWKHWHKDDALLPSGLLGPVTISTQGR